MRYRGPAKLLTESGDELGDVVVTLDRYIKLEGEGPWDGLVETADRSSIGDLVRGHTEATLVLPTGKAGTVVIRRLTIDSPIAAVAGSGEAPF